MKPDRRITAHRNRRFDVNIDQDFGAPAKIIAQLDIGSPRIGKRAGWASPVNH